MRGPRHPTPPLHHPSSPFRTLHPPSSMTLPRQMKRKAFQLHRQIHRTQPHVGRHLQTHRRKIDDRLDTTRHELVAHLLGAGHGHRNYADVDVVLPRQRRQLGRGLYPMPLNLPRDLVAVAVHHDPEQKPALSKSAIRQQRGTQVAHAGEPHVPRAASHPQDVGEPVVEPGDLIAAPAGAELSEVAQVAPDLRIAEAQLARQRARADKRGPLLPQQRQFPQVQRQPRHAGWRNPRHECRVLPAPPAARGWGVMGAAVAGHRSRPRAARRHTPAEASTIRSMEATPCAVERNIASHGEGGTRIPASRNPFAHAANIFRRLLFACAAVRTGPGVKNTVSIEAIRLMVTGTPALAAPRSSPCASASVRACSDAYGRSRRKVCSAPTPAATASGCPANVPAWSPSPSGASRLIIVRGPPTAPIGKPPPIILPNVVRSGVTPKASCAPPSATRNPVTTSSKINTMPCWRVSSRTR